MWDLLLTVIFITGLLWWTLISLIGLALVVVTIIDWRQQRGS